MEKTGVYAVFLAFADWFRLATAGSGSAGRRTRVRLPRVVRLAALELRLVPSTPTVASDQLTRARSPRALGAGERSIVRQVLYRLSYAPCADTLAAPGEARSKHKARFPPFSRWPGVAIDLLTVRSSLEQPVLPQELPGDRFFGFSIHVHSRVQVPQGLLVQLLGYGGEDVRELGVLVHNLLADGK